MINTDLELREVKELSGENVKETLMYLSYCIRKGLTTNNEKIDKLLRIAGEQVWLDMNCPDRHMKEFIDDSAYLFYNRQTSGTKKEEPKKEEQLDIPIRYFEIHEPQRGINC